MSTTGELHTMLNLNTGESLFGMTLYTDRQRLKSGELGKGKKAPTLVQNNLADLFHDLHMICNEHGVNTLADWMRGSET